MRLTQNSVRRYSPKWRYAKEETNCWIKSLFLFLCVQKVFSKLHNVTVEPLMADGLFWQCFSYFSGPWQCYLLGSQWDSHKLPGFHPKYLKLCSEDELSFYGFGMTIFILGWSNPLSKLTRLLYWADNAAYKWFKSWNKYMCKWLPHCKEVLVFASLLAVGCTQICLWSQNWQNMAQVQTYHSHLRHQIYTHTHTHTHAPEPASNPPVSVQHEETRRFLWFP